FDHGLAIRERGTWRAVSADIDARINALHVDAAHRLWIATASGLHVLAGDQGPAAPYHVARATRADGLPSRSVLSLAGTRDGRTIAGTSRGAVILGQRPERLGPKRV